jgi:outer membrane lipoprotein-sorting protein
MMLRLILPVIVLGVFGLFGAITPSFAKTGFESNPDVKKAEAYLQGLKTAKADFVQISSLGSRLSGQFYLNRPGKLRFDYNEVDDFIVADGVFVYFYDSQLGEQSNAPIGQTLADA